jgi:hypothetical protein
VGCPVLSIVADYVKLNNENYPDLDQFDLEISINMMRFFLAFMSRMEIALKGIDYANGESLSSEELNLLMNNINNWDKYRNESFEVIKKIHGYRNARLVK